MAQQTKAYLKGRFTTGSKPSQQDFIDLIDSLLHVNDLESANAMVIDTRINTYDAAQKAQTAGAKISTIGDVLRILRDFAPTVNVKTDLDAAGGSVTWASVQSKPESLGVTWDEYSFSTDSFLFPSSAIPGTSVYKIIEDYAPANIKTVIAGKKWVILDIGITEIPVTSPSLIPTYNVVRLRHVKIGVDPRIVITS
jgi:hypothetical protein